MSLQEINDSLKGRLEAAIVETEESRRGELKLKRAIVKLERKCAAVQKGALRLPKQMMFPWTRCSSSATCLKARRVEKVGETIYSG